VRSLVPPFLLLALAAPARADDVDPEPPPGRWIFRSLAGTWRQTRARDNGAEVGWTATTFRFDRGGGGKYEVNSQSQAVTLKLDKKRRDVLTFTYERNRDNPRRYFFKIHKGELYLVADDSNDPDAKADFSGAGKNQVMIFQRARK
jgi:hypothetical protein